MVGSDLSVYQMASLWRDNINSALKSMSFSDAIDTQLDENQGGEYKLPLIGFLSLFSSNSFFITAIQFSMFILIQIVAILITFNFMNRRNKYVFDEFQKRLKVPSQTNTTKKPY